MTRLLRRAVLTGCALLSTPVWAAPEASPAPPSAPVAEVAIAYGKAGLKLGETPIFRGQVDAAAWDSAQELIWFTKGATLHVIDLRDPQRAAVPIAEKMPDGGFAVTGVSTADSGTSYAGHYPILVFSAKPKIDPGSGAYGGIWEDQDKEARKKISEIKLVGTLWLTAQVARAPARPAAPAATFGDAGRVALPKGVGACDDKEMCGTARTFGPTTYRLVVTSHSCGDACHTACALYDPAGKRYTNPEGGGPWSARPEGSGTCDGYVFSPSGTSYLNGQSVCRIAATVNCTKTEDWNYVGWYRGAAK
jgi:hypothetical protein